MNATYRRASCVALTSAFLGMLSVAACSNASKPMDDSLKQDLAAAGGSGLDLATSSATASLVISPDEAGPGAMPQRAVRKPSVKPAPKPAEHLAANDNSAAPAPAPTPVIAAQAPSAPSSPRSVEPAPRPIEPPPLPAIGQPNSRGQGQQKGVYKTEGQIFQQMPWIRP
jgi:hypothetical protein